MRSFADQLPSTTTEVSDVGAPCLRSQYESEMCEFAYIVLWFQYWSSEDKQLNFVIWREG